MFGFFGKNFNRPLLRESLLANANQVIIRYDDLDEQITDSNITLRTSENSGTYVDSHDTELNGEVEIDVRNLSK